jgi:hypothetical protein
LTHRDIYLCGLTLEKILIDFRVHEFSQEAQSSYA